MKLSFQSSGISPLVKTASTSCLVSSTPSSPTFRISALHLAKLDIEEHSIAPIDLVFVSEHKLTSLIAYMILTNDVMACAGHQFGDTVNALSFGHTATNSSFITSNFASQMACFAKHLAPLPTVIFASFAQIFLSLRASSILNGACSYFTASPTCSYRHKVSGLYS